MRNVTQGWYNEIPEGYALGYSIISPSGYKNHVSYAKSVLYYTLIANYSTSMYVCMFVKSNCCHDIMILFYCIQHTHWQDILRMLYIKLSYSVWRKNAWCTCVHTLILVEIYQQSYNWVFLCDPFQFYNLILSFLLYFP